MMSYFLRDSIDCVVKVWSVLYFSNVMEKQESVWAKKLISLCVFSAFVLGQRYVLNRNTLSEAFVRNVLLYLLTCFLMISWRKGQRQYLVFLASIVFFLWGGWLKLFTPVVFASLHLPTFGYSAADAFPLIPVTLAENACRILVILLMRNTFFEIEPDREISAKEAFLALIPAVIDHTTVLILYYLTVVAPSDQVAGISVEMTLLTLMLVFGMPCMLAATEKQFQLQREQMRLLQMENQMNRQVREFERRRLSDEQARRIYHDLNKHLQVLEGMTAGGGSTKEVSEYVSDMIQSIRDVAPRIHTGNHVLDTLLAQKLEECQADGIAFDCMVDFAHTDFIRYADVVTMFANTVDNAMEAVQGLPSDQRRISLSAGTIGGQVIVKCENPFSGQLQRQADGLLRTSKKETGLHGIGLGNLKRIVESYGGLLQIEMEHALFRIEWMIPVPVDS